MRTHLGMGEMHSGSNSGGYVTSFFLLWRGCNYTANKCNGAESCVFIYSFLFIFFLHVYIIMGFYILPFIGWGLSMNTSSRCLIKAPRLLRLRW